MKTHCGSRLFRRSCRPALLPVTRYQVRQKVDRMRDLYELEAVLELSRAKPDINYLLQLDLESNYLRDVLASIEEVRL
jgi:hypothetical protein